ncbi:hypothetical protein HDU85_001271 [Gaertneriomyces sp. JEL0708]|nr:hypothetical protein HDU85_001271 [Gaertneriomyces sp. JEL0708]
MIHRSPAFEVFFDDNNVDKWTSPCGQHRQPQHRLVDIDLLTTSTCGHRRSLRTSTCGHRLVDNIDSNNLDYWTSTSGQHQLQQPRHGQHRPVDIALWTASPCGQHRLVDIALRTSACGHRSVDSIDYNNIDLLTSTCGQHRLVDIALRTSACGHRPVDSIALWTSICGQHRLQQHRQQQHRPVDIDLWTASPCGQHRLQQPRQGQHRPVDIDLWTASPCGQHRLVDSIALWTASPCEHRLAHNLD